MAPSVKTASVLVSVAAVTSSMGGAYAVLCSEAQQGETTTLIDANKSLFQPCLADLKISASTTATSASTDVWTSFISEDYLQDANADAVCASDSCVKALIQAMENLPDCCTQTSAATRNLPRLADDILHQCDVRDAKLLASELEAEISKLPDLKVQIKSLGTKSGSVSGSIDASVGDGVDVIIDVKKRELMKSGGQGDSVSDSNNTVAATSSEAVDLLGASASLLLAAACTAAYFVL